MATDIIVSEMTSATQINTNDLMIMTQPDLQAETGYSTKKGTVLQVANKMLKGTEYLTDLPDFTDKTVLGGLEELKGDLTALLPVNTASGAIANFDTDLALPLVECKANIVASQASGTPTPSTPLPISGFTSCTISVADENMSVQDTYTVSWQTEAGTVYGGVLDVTRGKLTVNFARAKISDLNWYYTSALSCFNTTDLASVVKGGNNGALCECESLLDVALSTASINANDNFIRFNLKSDGTAETGNFAVGALALKDTSYSDVPSMIAAIGDYYILYELATPFDIDLTPVQINALLGVNNVYNDTNGDTEVKYKEGIQHYIDKKIAATQALIL